MKDKKIKHLSHLKNNSCKKLQSLHEHAEKILMENSIAIKKARASDIRKILHELNIHQIELEAQNEELQIAYAELEESRNRYINLFDFSPIGYFILNQNGLIDEVNLTGANLLGIERCYLLKTSLFRFIADEFHDIFYHHRKRAYDTELQQICELKFIKKDKTHFYAQLNSTLIKHEVENTSRLQIAVTDITSRHQMEEEANQQKKELTHFSQLYVAGKMATEIAHELNQPLTAILLYAEGCLNKLPKNLVSEDIFQILERVIIQANRAGKIIHRLNAFLKKEQLKKNTLININCIVKDTLHLMEHEIARCCAEIQLELADNLPLIKADSIQLQQVILNIIRNAIEAMHTTKIRTFKLNIQTYLNSQNKIVIYIIDNGPGIPENDLQKIFNSFFTTKTQNMGIGLTICRSIIEAHNGDICVMPNDGKGAKFRILLPIADFVEINN